MDLLREDVLALRWRTKGQELLPPDWTDLLVLVVERNTRLGNGEHDTLFKELCQIPHQVDNGRLRKTSRKGEISWIDDKATDGR